MRHGRRLPFLFVASVLPIFFVRVTLADEPSQPSPAEVARLVIRISDPDTDWDVRQSAEQALAKLPAGLVLPVLVTHMPDEPAGVFYPQADSPAADKDAPPAWQAFYAARRVWVAQTSGDGRPLSELAELLPDLLRAARTAEAKAAVAARLATAWSDRAEEPLARLFRDSAEPPPVRGRAAEALLAHKPERFRGEVAVVADGAAWSSPLKQSLFFALTAPGDHARAPKPDPFTVALGFRLTERHAREKDLDDAYACALRLEDYLDQRFRPQPSRDTYGPDPESDSRFRRETLENARKWWAGHGPAIERESTKGRPGPA